MTNTPFHFDQDRPIDIICMGRVAVDLYAEQIGSRLSEAKTFQKYLGGCAGNIAVGTSRLGLKSMMFSCVGQDEMGLFLKQTLQQEGVHIDLLQETSKHLTGLVLLGVKPPRDFPLIFYRNDCADMQLKPEHANEFLIKQAKAILLTGTSLSTQAMRDTTHHVIRVAKKLATAIVLDLDYRPVLWGLTAAGNGENRYLSNPQVSEVYQQILADCDLIVGTGEEICIAGGSEHISQSIQKIRAHTSAPIVIKLGEKGCHVYFHQQQDALEAKPFPVDILNVLGAGDGFMAGLLRGLLRNESWQNATTYANACGALVVTRHGCAPAMPYWDELQYFMSEFARDNLVWKSAELNKLHQQHEMHSATKTLIKRPNGFADGVNKIVMMNNNVLKTHMNFSSIKLRKNERFQFSPDYEFAALLMTGRIRFFYPGSEKVVERTDYFSQTPSVLHCPANTSASFEALTDCEVLLIETENKHSFLPVLFNEHNLVELEHRGKNILENTSYRIVRTVFDKRNRPESNLVVGEIITFQGRWSSYPPHYHSQPEIYHYRFSEPHGFAFGENGADVLRIEHNDTYQITESQEHAHCTAPGYAMYTLWFIRHEEENPYVTPTFRTEHEWTRHQSSIKRAWVGSEN